MSTDVPLLLALADRDIAPCATLMVASEPWTHYDITIESATALWRHALESGAFVTVAHLRDQTVGFAWYIPRAGFGLSGYLKLLGVSTACRGHGVGSALLEHTERQARLDGQDDLFLLVSDFNVAAQHFYQRHGYTQVGRLEDYVLPGIAELLYRKRLLEGDHAWS